MGLVNYLLGESEEERAKATYVQIPVLLKGLKEKAEVLRTWVDRLTRKAVPPASEYPDSFKAYCTSLLGDYDGVEVFSILRDLVGKDSQDSNEELSFVVQSALEARRSDLRVLERGIGAIKSSRNPWKCVKVFSNYWAELMHYLNRPEAQDSYSPLPYPPEEPAFLRNLEILNIGKRN